ncbi:MAG: chemotaxis protein, partial [Halomonas sp.]|nr:chemotaxis protein [Halomonas sp.]
VTQQNAERVQSSARAAYDLHSQVALLANAIAVLRLRGAGQEAVDRATRFKAAEARRTPADKASAKALPGATTRSPAVRQPRPAEAATADEWEAF